MNWAFWRKPQAEAAARKPPHPLPVGKYRTRGGGEVEIVSSSLFRLVGKFSSCSPMRSYWAPDGRYAGDVHEHPYDLMWGDKAW